MIPVTQTIFGGEEGNCFAACLASILHRDLEQVPNFCAKPDTWWKDVNEWLYTNYRMYLMCFNLETEEGKSNFRESAPPQFNESYNILSGPAPRGFRHSCVGKGLDLAHDPHPSRDGLLRFDQIDLFVSAGSQPSMRTIKQPIAARINPHTFPWRYW